MHVALRQIAPDDRKVLRGVAISLGARTGLGDGIGQDIPPVIAKREDDALAFCSSFKHGDDG
jgi:hypothetical protein